MPSRSTHARRKKKNHCANCDAEFTARDVRRTHKHRDGNTRLIVYNYWCPNCSHMLAAYEDESVNPRRNRYGVGWSPR